jgi:hypothetical protein
MAPLTRVTGKLNECDSHQENHCTYTYFTVVFARTDSMAAAPYSPRKFLRRAVSAWRFVVDQ